jgi:hypothetical protein
MLRRDIALHPDLGAQGRRCLKAARGAVPHASSIVEYGRPASFRQ